MNAAQYETPENIVVSYQTAGFGSRFLAYLIDQTLLYAVLGAAAGVWVVLGRGEIIEEITGGGWPLPSLLAAGFGALTLANVVAYGLAEWFFCGRTPGKKLMSLRVASVNGFTLDSGAVLLRNLARVADCLFLLPPVVSPALFLPLVTARRQRLGDLLAGTVVIRERPGAGAELLELREKLESVDLDASLFKFHAERLAKLSAPAREAAERALLRWPDLSDGRRHSLREALVLPLAERLGCPAPEVGDERDFLRCLLAALYRQEYRRIG